RYLAEQVQLEAEKFGIPYAEIDDDNSIPDDFQLGTRLLITHVQKVFNGKSIFGIGNKSIHIGTILLDDSHACIDAIKSSLTIKVSNEHELYKFAIALFEDDVKDQGVGSFLEIQSGDYNTMLPVPYWTWDQKKDEITRKLSELRNTREI